MADIQIEVTSRIAGARPNEAGMDPVIVRLLEQRITVADLIRRTVEEQVRDLTLKRKLSLEQAHRTLDRQYLTDADVESQAEHGRIGMPGSRQNRASPPEIDVDREVEKAQHAFNARAFYILVDGRQMESLDDELVFAPGVKVVFLRLMPLVGG
jgi:hypothetical protein